MISLPLTLEVENPCEGGTGTGIEGAKYRSFGYKNEETDKSMETCRSRTPLHTLYHCCGYLE